MEHLHAPEPMRFALVVIFGINGAIAAAVLCLYLLTRKWNIVPPDDSETMILACLGFVIVAAALVFGNFQAVTVPLLSPPTVIGLMVGQIIKDIAFIRRAVKYLTQLRTASIVEV
jgi:hypothetical protein